MGKIKRFLKVPLYRLLYWPAWLFSWFMELYDRPMHRVSNGMWITLYLTNCIWIAIVVIGTVLLLRGL